MAARSLRMVLATLDHLLLARPPRLWQRTTLGTRTLTHLSLVLTDNTASTIRCLHMTRSLLRWLSCAIVLMVLVLMYKQPQVSQ